MIVPDVGNPFFISMVRGVEDVAQGGGYSVVLCNTDEKPPDRVHHRPRPGDDRPGTAGRLAARAARPSLVRRADFRERGGFEAMASLLADADLDAVFVANNLMTVGALECLIQQDVQVPREIGVVGFDEIPWASLVRPSLSTVAQPTYEMGKAAGELLTTRLLAPSRPAETVVLRATLNVRASSTPMATSLRGIRQA
jgi:LacI family transcriptional regulator